MSEPRYKNNFSIASRFELLSDVEDEILESAGKCGFDEQQCFAIKLALEEALTNAIKHGNKLDETKQVKVDYQVDSHRLVVDICDEGAGFTPSKVPDPTLSENLEKPSGRGVMLMRAYMTDVSFDDSGRCVRLVKDRRCSLPDLPKPNISF